MFKLDLPVAGAGQPPRQGHDHGDLDHGQYPQPWAGVYESLPECPDELLLSFHHVPYGHVLHSGRR
ncbi:hypothetical protein [Pseudonocardia nigra]|uniref:hypothetical protein n=1 Tax=Pseudonocardia nigra TaxID=1921578 RepID=UPI001C5D11DD|nr:hypothetical protein [Pseudonocardia nigra]